MAISLGDLLVSLKLDASGFKQSIDKTGAALTTLGQNVQAKRKDLEALTIGLQQVGQAVTTAGAVIGGFGLAIVGSLGLATKGAGTFQLGIQNIINLIGSGGEKFAGPFAAGIRSVASEFGQGKDALTKGLFDIVSAGRSTGEALDILRESALLATGGVTSVDVTTSALLTTLKSYEGAARDAADASDYLFSIQKYGRTTLEEVASNFGTVAPLAAQAGLSLEDLGASFSTATLGGTSTAEVVTALQALLKSFIEPTDDAKKAAQELGFEMTAASLQGDNYTDTLKKISAGSIEQINAISGSVRGFRALAPIVQDVNKYEEIRVGILNRQGVAAEAAAKVQETFNNTMARAAEVVGNVADRIGEALLPILTEVGSAFISVVEKLDRWIEENPRLTAGLTLAAAAIGVVATGIGGLLIVLGPLMMSVAALLPLIAASGTAGLAGAMGMLTTAVSGLVASFLSIAAPVVIAVAALAAIAYVVKQNWEVISAFASGVKIALGDLWGSILEKLEGFITGWKLGFTAIGDTFSWLLEGPLKQFIEGWKLGFDAMGVVWEGVTDVASKYIDKYVSNLSEAAGYFVAIDRAAREAGPAIELFNTDLEDMSETVKQALDRVADSKEKIKVLEAALVELRERFEAGKISASDYTAAQADLQRQLDALGGSAKGVVPELSKFEKAVQDAIKGLHDAAEEAKVAATAQQELVVSSDKLGKEIEDLHKSFKDGKITADDYEKQLSKLETQYTLTQKAADRFDLKGLLDEMEKSAKAAADLQRELYQMIPTLGAAASDTVILEGEFRRLADQAYETTLEVSTMAGALDIPVPPGLTEANARLGEINKTLDATAETIRKKTERIDVLKGALAELKVQLDSGAISIEEYKARAAVLRGELEGLQKEGTGFGSVIQDISTKIDDFGKAFDKAIRGIFTGEGNPLKGLWQAFKDIFIGPDGIVSIFTRFIGETLAKSFIDPFKKAIKDMLEGDTGIGKLFQKVFGPEGIIRKAVEAAINWIIDLFSKAFGGGGTIQDLVSNVVVPRPQGPGVTTPPTVPGGGVPAGGGGGMPGGVGGGGATALGAMIGGPVGAAIGAVVDVGLQVVGLLQQARQEGTLNAIEENTRALNFRFGAAGVLGTLFLIKETLMFGLFVKVLEEIRNIVKDAFSVGGIVVGQLDTIGRFQSEILANLQQINQGGVGGGGVASLGEQAAEAADSLSDLADTARGMDVEMGETWGRAAPPPTARVPGPLPGRARGRTFTGPVLSAREMQTMDVEMGTTWGRTWQPPTLPSPAEESQAATEQNTEQIADALEPTGSLASLLKEIVDNTAAMVEILASFVSPAARQSTLGFLQGAPERNYPTIGDVMSGRAVNPLTAGSTMLLQKADIEALQEELQGISTLLERANELSYEQLSQLKADFSASAQVLNQLTYSSRQLEMLNTRFGNFEPAPRSVNITVNAQTNADPQQIADAIGWELRWQGMNA